MKVNVENIRASFAGINEDVIKRIDGAKNVKRLFNADNIIEMNPRPLIHVFRDCKIIIMIEGSSITAKGV